MLISATTYPEVRLLLLDDCDSVVKPLGFKPGKNPGGVPLYR